MDKGKSLRISKGYLHILIKKQIKVNIAIIFFIQYNLFMIKKSNFKQIILFSIIFSLLLSNIYSETKPNKAKIPENIQQKIEKIPETKKSWYIRKVSNQKAGSVVYGPFETNEQALCIWIYESLPAKKNYCISKNNVYLTDNPETFYPEAMAVVQGDFNTLGNTKTLEKYFLNSEIIALTGQYEKIKKGVSTVQEDTYKLSEEQLKSPEKEKNKEEIKVTETTQSVQNTTSTKKTYTPEKNGKAKIPSTITQKINKTKATKKSIYIRKCTGTKVEKIEYGPFDTREQAICFWIYKDIPAKSDYCVTRDSTFLTSDPMYFFAESSSILEEFAENGDIQTLNKYFNDLDVIKSSGDYYQGQDIVIIEDKKSKKDNTKKTETKTETKKTEEKYKIATKPEKAEIPPKVLRKLETIDSTNESYFIYTAKNSTPQKKIYGPFENLQEAICVWYYEALTNDYCITKNKQFITNTPNIIYSQDFNSIKNYFEDYGVEATFDKIFFDILPENEASSYNLDIEQQTNKYTPKEIEYADEGDENYVNNYEYSYVNKNTQYDEEENNDEESSANVESNSLEPEEENTKSNEQNNVEIIDFEEDLESVNNLEENKNSSKKEEPVIKTDKEIKKENNKTETTKKVTVKESEIEKEIPEEIEVLENIKKDAEIDKNHTLDKTDSYGRTELMFACKDGDISKVKKLLSSKANINQQDKDGWTPLMYAVRYQSNFELVKLLISSGASVTIKNRFDSSSLLLSIMYNPDTKILQNLLEYYSLKDKEVIKSFIVLLTENSINENDKINKVQIYLEKEIPLNDLYKGKTPLMYAAEYSTSTKVIKLLLDNNADKKVLSSEKKTAYDYAKKNKLLTKDSVYKSLEN